MDVRIPTLAATRFMANVATAPNIYFHEVADVLKAFDIPIPHNSEDYTLLRSLSNVAFKALPEDIFLAVKQAFMRLLDNLPGESGILDNNSFAPAYWEAWQAALDRIETHYRR